MNHTTANHYVIMAIIMIIASLLSTMNIWADKLSDIRLSINDIYMALLMTGWMFLLMGLVYKELHIAIIGALFVIGSIWAIRTQLLVSETQYLYGMIPHHSMAIHMSKKLLEKPNMIQPLLSNIIQSQEKEIHFMKAYQASKN
jgi:hypothetical protein